MPQMSPFNWIFLYMMFIMILYLTMTKIFSFIMITNTEYNNYSTNLCNYLTWMW